MLEVAEGNRDEVGDTQRRYTSGLWTLVPGKLGCWTLTRVVSGLVGKLHCVKSCVLVKNCGQLLCEEILSSGELAPRVI